MGPFGRFLLVDVVLSFGHKPPEGEENLFGSSCSSRGWSGYGPDPVHEIKDVRPCRGEHPAGKMARNRVRKAVDSSKPAKATQVAGSSNANPESP